MIDELKLELEKTFNRKVVDRGACEALVQDIYEKTGAVLSYNTLRRMFGLAEYRKPRESTLDHLAVYCGFKSFIDFSQRYAEIDLWPTWENLYVSLASDSAVNMIEMLLFRKRRNDHFTISFTIVIRELLNRGDAEGIRAVFEYPAFQFDQLPYDEVAQIGVLIGLHFRNFDNERLERELLLIPNFRDTVFKIFVDYGRLNGKYANWISFLAQQPDLDSETLTFISCLEAWKNMLNKLPVSDKAFDSLPKLSTDQHPILFGRIFGIRMLLTKSIKVKNQLIEQMSVRLKLQPNFATELLYEPAVQSLVMRDSALKKFVAAHEYLIHDIKFWYHFSQVSIHRVFQTSLLIEEKQFTKALSILENIPYGHIRHGYREFIEIYVTFFRTVIAKKLETDDFDHWQQQFEARQSKITYPIYNGKYFINYFKS